MRAMYERGNVWSSRRERHQIDLVGPVDTDHQWQARVAGGFVTECFPHRLGPAAAPSVRAVAGVSAGARPARRRKRHMIHIDLDPADCLPCPDRARCTRSKRAAGTGASPCSRREEYAVLLAGQSTTTDARSSPPSTHDAPALRDHLARGARLRLTTCTLQRGVRKTHLQQVATARGDRPGTSSDWLTEHPDRDHSSLAVRPLGSGILIYQRYRSRTQPRAETVEQQRLGGLLYRLSTLARQFPQPCRTLVVKRNRNHMSYRSYQPLHRPLPLWPQRWRITIG